MYRYGFALFHVTVRIEADNCCTLLGTHLRDLYDVDEAPIAVAVAYVQPAHLKRAAYIRFKVSLP